MENKTQNQQPPPPKSAAAPDEKSNSWARLAWTHLETVRKSNPLVQCITNFVSMDLVANVLLAAGASPAMVHNIEEIPDFTPKAHAVYINVGTLTPDWLPAMKMAAQVANESGRPWVLDPVAAGASRFRLAACLELLSLKPTVVRGNGSEILALFKGTMDENSKGVDSLHESIDAIEAAKSLARITGSIIAVSGAVDIITDGERALGAKNGVSELQKITATGCAVTALVAAFVALHPSQPFESAATALSVFGVAGEVGMATAKGPASLRVNLIDAIHGLDRDDVLQRVCITNV